MPEILDEMLFVKDYLWFKSLNIHYAVGVDGISVAMICAYFTGSFCRNICIMGS